MEGFVAKEESHGTAKGCKAFNGKITMLDIRCSRCTPPAATSGWYRLPGPSRVGLMGVCVRRSPRSSFIRKWLELKGWSLRERGYYYCYEYSVQNYYNFSCRSERKLAWSQRWAGGWCVSATLFVRQRAYSRKRRE